MLDVKIISIDSETNKIALSIRALERTNELSHIQEYLKSGNVKKSFGTFGELLKSKLGKKD